MAIFAVLCTHSAFGDQCPPSVIVAGNSELVEKIGDILIQRGIETRPIGQCPMVTAWVATTDGKVKVVVEDSQKRRKEMIAADAAEAATFIESWALSQAGLEFFESSPVSPEPKKAEPRLKQSPAEKKKTPGDFFGGGPEVLLGFDEDPSFWIGGSFAGCGRAGPVCLGGLFRYMQDLGVSTESDDYDLSRQSADTMATLEFPMETRRIKMRPGFGLGLGWMQTRGTTEPLVDIAMEENQSFNTLEFIGQVHFSVSGSVGRSIDLGGRVFLRPGIPAHTGDFVRCERLLPGEPWGFAGLGLFMEYLP
jgi:hypothetical protein